MHSSAHLCQTSSALPMSPHPCPAVLDGCIITHAALSTARLSPQSQLPLQDSLSPLLSFRYNRVSLLSKAGSSMRTLNLNFSGLMESLVFTCDMKSQAVKWPPKLSMTIKRFTWLCICNSYRNLLVCSLFCKKKTWDTDSHAVLRINTERSSVSLKKQHANHYSTLWQAGYWCCCHSSIFIYIFPSLAHTH